MSSSEGLDQEVINQLRDSAPTPEDEIQDIVLDQHGRVISGRHRLESKPKWRRRTIQVKDDEDYLLKRSRAKVQRTVSEAERKADLIELALYLEKNGVVKDQVCVEVCKRVTWLSKSYIIRMLPDEYKQKTFVEAGLKGAEARLSSAFNTPEELVVKMVQLRDEGLHYNHLYRESMANSIPNYFRVSYAIDKGKPLNQIFDLMKGVPISTESPRASEHAVKTYTSAEQKLAEAFSRLKVNYVTNVSIERPEVTVDGKPMKYWPDFIVEGKYIVECEGEGSSSKNNPARDEFLVGKGYIVKHVSNESVTHDPDGLAKSLIDEFRGNIVKEETTTTPQIAVKEEKPVTEAKKRHELDFKNTCPSCGKEMNITLESFMPLLKKQVNVKVKSS